MNQYVYWKKRLSFWLSIMVSALVIWGGYLFFTKSLENQVLMAALSLMLTYLVAFILFFWFSHIIMIDRLQGNVIKIIPMQFPEIANIINNQSAFMGIKKVPTMYLLESGGILNAFATHFVGRNYVMVYADMIEKAFSEGKNVVEFIMAYELAHIKKNPLLKRLFIFTAIFFFPLTLAYSRTCEYTCDHFDFAQNDSSAKRSLVLLSAGKFFYDKVNIEEYLKTSLSERIFAKWFSEKLSTHPHTTNRLRRILKLGNEF